ncbi:MAG: phosphoglycerate kinase [Alphaproteobacteria bacterium]|nr:phosphoglycerate kinase [Alphaproteobacteria bacterium]
MASFKTIDDIDVAGKRVFLRADLNVPMKDGKITDTTRIDRTVPTITDLIAKGAKVIVASHFGRPKGQRIDSMSLKPVANALSKALNGRPVAFAEDCVGLEAEKAVNSLEAGGVVLLENLRFHSSETINDPTFAKKLADLADVYVNDAFSSAHRAHASTEAITRQLPHAAGRLMQAELEALEKALGNPIRPVAAVIGGAKVSTKLELLGNMVEKVDVLIIGGGMANTFLFAQGVDIGKSLCEKDMADTAREVLEKAKKHNCEIILPSDVVVADKFAERASYKTVSANDVPEDMMILDSGSKSAKEVADKLESCQTLIWNGPLGAFEIKPFDSATNMVARKAAELTKQGKLLTVAGGGDTVSALANAGVQEDFSCISTAGGAFLEWLEGKELPGIKALEN